MNKIFLSSTWSDLQPHREAVLFALNKLQQKVVAMEYFGARNGTPLSECLKLVRASDIFVLVIGMRYGAKDETNISITQREYEQAHSDNKYILTYIISDQEHPVLPKNIDFGEDATRLAAFKNKLLERHLCDFFASPSDLAVKVVVDLIHNLQLPTREVEIIQSSLEADIPGFFAAGGYSWGLSRETIDFSKLLRRTSSGLSLESPHLNNLLYAGYVALNLSEGNFKVLRGVLTFDANLWELICLLCKHYELSEASLSDAIACATDAIHLRILIGLAGRLRYEDCAESICSMYVHNPHLEKQMIEYRVSPYTVRDAVKDALSDMSENILPIVNRYEGIAKSKRYWQAKKAMQYVIHNIEART